MEKKIHFSLNRILASIALVGGFVTTGHAQFISNGSFEAEPVGTAVVIGSTPVVDTSTFTDWRVFSVGSPPVEGFSVMSVANASDGNSAVRIDMTGLIAGGSGADYSIDRSQTEIPVVYGTNYLISFDAAWINGSINLLLAINEVDQADAPLEGTWRHYYFPVLNANYQNFSVEWSPSSPSATAVYFRFMPFALTGNSVSLLLDHVQLNVEIPPNLILGDLLQSYDGSVKAASVTTLPSGLAVDLTYDGLTNEPVSVGSYTVIGTINDATHQGSATNTLVIRTSAAYNAWKALWFTTAQQTNAAVSGTDVYFDADDFSNWEEYIAGTDPTDPQSFFGIHVQSGSSVSNGFVLGWSSVSGRVYSANGSPSLLEPFVPLQTHIVWPQASYTNPITEAETEHFFQMEVRTSGEYPNAEIIGSTHVVPRYFFGTEDCLNQGAQVLLDMGSKVIKIWYYNGSETPSNMYPWNSTWATPISLPAGLTNTHYTDLFDKPFKTFVMNVTSFVHPTNRYYWKDSISQAQIDQEEDEFYVFTKALLLKYAGTGKTFILQHHEGDWHTRGHTDSSIPAAAGVHDRMVQWLNARQRGVTRAREELGDLDVFVYHAAEINLVVNSMNDGQLNMVNDVLPFTVGLDLISYSCYDASINPALTGNPEELRRAVQYIKTMMPDSAAFGDDNVYLGEYGIPANHYPASNVEMVMTNTVAIGLEEDCPYIIYWQLYDNELIDSNTPLPVTSNDDVRGYWLVKPDGTKSWSYEYLKSRINE